MKLKDLVNHEKGRLKPSYAPIKAWGVFQEYADTNGLGEMVEDWGPWWLCWWSGFKTGMGLK